MSPVEKDHTRGWNAAVAQQLRAERAASGMTVDELADKSGVPKRTLMRLLNEQRAIDVAHLASLAEAVNLTLDALLSRAAERVVEEHDTAGNVRKLRPSSGPTSTVRDIDKLVAKRSYDDRAGDPLDDGN